MPLRYDIAPAETHVRITGTGSLTMPEMIAVVNAVAEDPRFNSHYTVIFDISNAEYTAELSDGEAFVAVLKRRMNDFKNRFALLVPQHLQFLAKLYSVLASTGGFDRMQCFTELKEAEAWCRTSP
jgi:hypothetical protein